MEKNKVEISLTCTDFPIICRICLSKGDLQPLAELGLLDLFKNITNVKIELEDKLPKNVCIICINQLENVSSFINLSKSNDSNLRQILKNSTKESYIKESVSDSDVDVSSEFLVGLEDDNAKIENCENSCSIGNIKGRISVDTNGCRKSDKKSYRHSTKRQASKCEICGEFFNTKSKLSEHQKRNSSCRTRQYKCMICEKAFYTKFRLTLHMRSHTKETPFECKTCFKKFRHSPNLKRHDDIVHKGLKPFKCDVCGKEFATFLRKTEHLRIHTGERPHICSYCGIGFKKYSTRYAHEMRHKIKNGEIPKSEKKPKRYARKKPEDPSELECDTCKKTFSSKQALYVHTQIHIGEKSFLCAVCGKGFLRKSHLEVHIRIHTGEKPYECGNCGKYFRQAACYRNHLLIHKGERSYKCEVCQRTFVQLGHLQSHLKTHTGEKPYKCTFCGKGFAQNGNLKAHTRIHTGERPYRCAICYMGFYDSTSLKKHRKSHGNFEEPENKFIDDHECKIEVQHI